VAARTAARGLSTSELEHIREALAGGRKPKVMFTAAAGQIAGQHGQVVQLTDPQAGDEWVVVRFGRDELPFSPIDLQIPPKGAPPRRPARAAAPVPDVPPGPPLLAGPPPPGRTPPGRTPTGNPPTVPTPREEATVTRPATTTSTAKAASGKQPGAEPADAAKPAGDGAGQPARGAAKAPARKAGRAKAPAALTVTLAYADGEWTVAAQQGNKALAKPYLIKATEALKMVGMLDVPGVQEAVEEIVSAARAEAQAAADRLRAELAEIEARLAELRDAP
jgi:hypothetical protein